MKIPETAAGIAAAIIFICIIMSDINIGDLINTLAPYNNILIATIYLIPPSIMITFCIAISIQNPGPFIMKYLYNSIIIGSIAPITAYLLFIFIMEVFP